MPGKRVRMLFIGNSFTTKNDLPTLLSAIAKAGKGITIESKVISAGGASLRRCNAVMCLQRGSSMPSWRLNLNGAPQGHP